MYAWKLGVGRDEKKKNYTGAQGNIGCNSYVHGLNCRSGLWMYAHVKTYWYCTSEFFKNLTLFPSVFWHPFAFSFIIPLIFGKLLFLGKSFCCQRSKDTYFGSYLPFIFHKKYQVCFKIFFLWGHVLFRFE